MMKLYIPFPYWEGDGLRFNHDFTFNYMLGNDVTWRNFTYNYGKDFTIVYVNKSAIYLHVVRNGVYKESIEYNENNLDDYARYFGHDINVYNRYGNPINILTKYDLKNYVEMCEDYRIDSKVKLKLMQEATRIILRQRECSPTDKEKDKLLTAYDAVRDLYLLSTRDDPAIAVPDITDWQRYGGYLWIVKMYQGSGLIDWVKFLPEAYEFVKDMSLLDYLRELDFPLTKWSAVAKLDAVIRNGSVPS